jgi:hypothetical protein
MLPSLQGLLALLAGGVLAGGLALGVLFAMGRTPSLASSRAGSSVLSALSSPVVARRFGVAVLAGVATLIVTRWIVGAAAVFALVASWNRLFGGAAAEQAQIDRLEALTQWTEGLRDTLSGGGGLEHAVPVSIEIAPALIRPQLQRMYDLHRAKIPLSVALYALADELRDASADVVIGSLIMNTMHSGQGLPQVLTRLAAAARGELDLRRKVLASRASTRRAAKAVLAITLGMAGGFRVFNPSYVKPYNTWTGQLVLLVVVAIFAAAFLWLRQLSTGGDPEPFLSSPAGGLAEGDARLIAHLAELAEIDLLARTPLPSVVLT